jgi:hypothetical protein
VRSPAKGASILGKFAAEGHDPMPLCAALPLTLWLRPRVW